MFLGEEIAVLEPFVLVDDPDELGVAFRPVVEGIPDLVESTAELLIRGVMKLGGLSRRGFFSLGWMRWRFLLGRPF
jgi:hypothetical protein